MLPCAGSGSCRTRLKHESQTRRAATSVAPRHRTMRMILRSHRMWARRRGSSDCISSTTGARNAETGYLLIIGAGAIHMLSSCSRSTFSAGSTSAHHRIRRQSSHLLFHRQVRLHHQQQYRRCRRQTRPRHRRRLSVRTRALRQGARLVSALSNAAPNNAGNAAGGASVRNNVPRSGAVGVAQAINARKCMASGSGSKRTARVMISASFGERAVCFRDGRGIVWAGVYNGTRSRGPRLCITGRASGGSPTSGLLQVPV